MMFVSTLKKENQDLKLSNLLFYVLKTSSEMVGFFCVRSFLVMLQFCVPIGKIRFATLGKMLGLEYHPCRPSGN